MPDIAPVHDLVLGIPDKWRINTIAFGRDGKLYANVSNDSLNLWNLVSYHWPEVLGAALGALALVVVVLVSRVRRRPQVRGESYCRKCNYHLAGIVGGSACPECGVDPRARRPVTGRTAARRLRLPVAVLLLAILGYTGMLVGGVRRDAAANLVRWPASKLAAWAKRNRVAWIERFDRRDCSIIAIDPESGRTSRIATGLGNAETFGLSISPDGRTLLTTLRDGRLAAIDLRSRRIVRSVPRLDGRTTPNSTYPPDGWVHVAGWAGPTTVYVQFFGFATNQNELFLWELSSGSMKSTCVLGMTQMAVKGGPPLIYATSNGGGGGGGTGSMIGLARVAVADYGEESVFGVRDLSDGGRELRRIQGPYWGQAAPVPGNGTFFIREWGRGGDIGLWSIADGVRVGEMEAPGFMGTLQDGPAGLAYDEERGRLFVATTNPHAVHVQDTVKKKWLALLKLKYDGLPHDEIAFSADGRWAAIGEVEVVAGPPKSFKQHLLLFDLSALEER